MIEIKEREELIDVLSDLGFFQYETHEIVKEAKDHALNAATLLRDDNERIFDIDAEVIREEGVGGHIDSISNYLANIGAKITMFDEEIDQGNQYSIVLNDMLFLIWTNSDDENYDDPWFAPATRFFISINDFLEQNECKERLYYDYIGNDTTMVFLTKEMYEIISKHKYLLKDVALKIPYLNEIIKSS